MARRHRDCDHCDTLEKELHDYKSTIKTLRKRLRSLEKELSAYGQLVSKESEEHTPPTPHKRVCPSCKEGTLVLTDLTIKLLETCSHCKYRRTIKKT